MDMKKLNWYPGHMKKTRELIEAHLKLVDVVVEVCDARIPASSRNPVIDEIVSGKTRIIILNKKDLADDDATKAWLAFFRSGGLHAVALNAMSGQGVGALYGRLERIAAEKAGSGTKKSKLPLRFMVVGIPNSGKSSLINRLFGRRAAQVGNRPGVTRGKQWLTLENGMQLLDTPGILWPKFEDPQVGLNLAFCGSIKDEIMDASELALELLGVLLRDHAVQFAERYGVACGVASGGVSGGAKGGAAGGVDEPLAVMEEIARKRGYVLQGKRIDYERTARALLDDFRSGKLGRVTLERPATLSRGRCF